MARITIVNVGMHGHVNPTLGFTEELVRRGHDVVQLCDAAFAPQIERTGARVRDYGSELGKMVATRAQAQLQGQDAWKAGQDFRSRMLDELQVTLPRLLEDFSGPNRPDVVVYDFISTAARLAAAKLGLPALRFFTTYASNEHFSLMDRMGAMHAAPDAAALADMRARLASLAARYGVETIEPDALLKGSAAHNLVFLPRSFQPMGTTFDASFHFVGPCLRTADLQGGDLDGLLPPGEGPLVVVSLGTIFHAWADFYRHVLDAFGAKPWRVVVALGPNIDPASLGPLPANVAVRAHLPQLALLRRADLFVTHAGMNSTMEALTFGVPMVAIPQMPEQELTAEQLAELGLGRYLKRAELTVPALAEAAEALLADQEVHARLARLQQDIREAGGTPAAASLIESLTAPARSGLRAPRGEAGRPAHP